MIKILVVGMTSNYGGMENVIINYYRKINHENFQIDFLCFDPKGLVFEDELKKYSKIYYLPSKRKKYFEYKRKLQEILSSNKYDFIWYNTCKLVNIDYLILAKKYGVKGRILHIHASKSMYNGILLTIYSKFREMINKKIESKYANIHFACSNEAAKFGFNKKIYDSKKYTIINNAIDVDKFKYNEKTRNELRRKYNIKDNEILLGTVGRLEPEKNQAFLLSILKELRKDNSNYKLVIIGNGSLKNDLLNISKEYNIQNEIIFLNSINNVYDYYQMMDIFVLPSFYEGLGLVLIEAQVSGLKCFASTGVPKKAQISNNLSYLDLSLGSSKWANAIATCNYEHNKNSVDALSSGFDINTETKKIEDIFINNYKN